MTQEKLPLGEDASKTPLGNSYQKAAAGAVEHHHRTTCVSKHHADFEVEPLTFGWSTGPVSTRQTKQLNATALKIKENGMPVQRTNPLTDDEVKELWKLFGPPPVLKTEDQEAYETLREEYVAYYRPTSRRQISFIRELVDTEWEMFGLVAIRTKLLRCNYRLRGEKASCNLLERPFWDVPGIDNGVDLLDRLDKWRNTATVRRNNLLRMIEYYCPAPDDNAGIPQAELKKLDQNEQKQLPAPPIAPTEENANDLATQNPDEPGERAKE